MAAVVPVVRLDLDDVGAEVAEERRRVRPREHGREIEDADAGEGLVAQGIAPFALRAPISSQS